MSLTSETCAGPCEVGLPAAAVVCLASAARGSLLVPGSSGGKGASESESSPETLFLLSLQSLLLALLLLWRGMPLLPGWFATACAEAFVAAGTGRTSAAMLAVELLRFPVGAAATAAAPHAAGRLPSASESDEEPLSLLLVLRLLLLLLLDEGIV